MKKSVGRKIVFTSLIVVLVLLVYRYKQTPYQTQDTTVPYELHHLRQAESTVISNDIHQEELKPNSEEEHHIENTKSSDIVLQIAKTTISSQLDNQNVTTTSKPVKHPDTTASTKPEQQTDTSTSSNQVQRTDSTTGSDHSDPAEQTDTTTTSNIDQKHEYTGNNDVFKYRRQHLNDICLDKGYKVPNTILESNITKSSMVETRHNILYCPIEKVGSTFWKRTIMAINSDGRFNSPYTVQILPGNKLVRYQKFVASMPQYIQKDFMEKAVSLMVVRDPYSKLFSGYVDKIYHPNHLFWRLTGGQINTDILSKTTEKDNVCSDQITFSDFIKYINLMYETNSTKLNRHFTSMHSHCDPCTVNYEYISKMETFKDDVDHILDKWKKRFNVEINFNDYEVDSAKLIAQTHIRLSFSAYSHIAEICNITKKKFLERTWNFLQISGLIPITKQMPYQSDIEVDRLTDEDFYVAVMHEVREVTNWETVKKQRHEALIQAYLSVSKEDMESLSQVVKTDCELFNYDNKPKYLFDKNTTVADFKYFDWL